MKSTARLALTGLVGATFMAQLGGNALNVALPELARIFAATSVAVQQVVLVYLATMTAGLLITGPLGDRLGRRTVLLGGLAVFGIGSLAATFAPDLGWLIGARALQGLGGAAMAAMSIALVMDALPRGRTGAALGVLSTASAVATMLAPSLGGVMVSAFGWRSMMAVNLPLVLITAALIARLHEPVRAAHSAPFFDGALLRDRQLAAGLSTSFLVALVMVSTLVVGPFVLANEMHLSLTETGLLMAAGPLMSVAFAVYAGHLADRIGTRRTTIGALAVFTLGGALLAIVVHRHDVATYVGGIVVLSIGYAAFQTPNSAAVIALAPADRRATVSGLLTLARNAGFIAGTGSIGALFSATNATIAFAADGALGFAALSIALLSRAEPVELALARVAGESGSRDTG